MCEPLEALDPRGNLSSGHLSHIEFIVWGTSKRWRLQQYFMMELSHKLFVFRLYHWPVACTQGEYSTAVSMNTVESTMKMIEHCSLQNKVGQASPFLQHSKPREALLWEFGTRVTYDRRWKTNASQRKQERALMCGRCPASSPWKRSLVLLASSQVWLILPPRRNN